MFFSVFLLLVKTLTEEKVGSSQTLKWYLIARFLDNSFLNCRKKISKMITIAWKNCLPMIQVRDIVEPRSTWYSSPPWINASVRTTWSWTSRDIVPVGVETWFIHSFIIHPFLLSIHECVLISWFGTTLPS